LKILLIGFTGYITKQIKIRTLFEYLMLTLYEIKPNLLKILMKLKNKNHKHYLNLMKKIDEITKSTPKNISHYKNLKNPKNHLKRVHINTSFILLFSYDKEKGIISFVDYKHHDYAYI
jgi:mRNA-degrading endonuclease RelE of RelBE toxin-antitoxin system